MNLVASKVVVLGITWNVFPENDTILNYLNSNYKNMTTFCDIFDDDSYDYIKSIAIKNIENKINDELKEKFKNTTVTIEDYIDIQPINKKQEKLNNNQIRKNKIVYSTVKKPLNYDNE